MEKCFCHFGGYQVKDAVARSMSQAATEEIEQLRQFGLGAAQRIYLEQLDKTRKPGWYYINSDTNINIGGLSVKKWFLHVTAWDTGDACVQTIVPAMQKYRELKRYYYYSDGAWTDWTYTNAPMVYGTEYLTNEIHNGKPVYAKTLNLGKLPNGTVADLGGWGSGGNYTPIRWSGYTIGKTAHDPVALPYKQGAAEINVGVSNWGIYISTSGDYTSQTAVITIWYIKE